MWRHTTKQVFQAFSNNVNDDQLVNSMEDDQSRLSDLLLCVSGGEGRERGRGGVGGVMGSHLSDYKNCCQDLSLLIVLCSYSPSATEWRLSKGIDGHERFQEWNLSHYCAAQMLTETKGGQRARTLGIQDWVHPDCDGSDHRTWECLEVPLPVLQKRRRLVMFFGFFLLNSVSV